MFTFNLVTPEKKLVTGEELEEIFIPGYKGELNILQGHAPLLTTLQTGILRYRLKGQSNFHSVAISWGYAQVTPNGVNVLAETAERPEDIDVGRAETALKTAENRIATEALDPEMLQKLSNKIARARVRKEVGGQA